MYNTNVLCTYKLIPDITDAERNMMYRIHILQIFIISDEHINDCLLTENNEIIVDTLDCIYHIFSKTTEFRTIIDKMGLNNIFDCFKDTNADKDKDKSMRDETLFKILFCYDFFDLIHRCIADFLLTKSVSPDNLNKLLNAL